MCDTTTVYIIAFPRCICTLVLCNQISRCVELTYGFSQVTFISAFFIGCVTQLTDIRSKKIAVFQVKAIAVFIADQNSAVLKRYGSNKRMVNQAAY
jgi:hypothetical protein